MEAIIEQRMMAKNLQLHVVDWPEVSPPGAEGTAPLAQGKKSTSTEYSVFISAPSEKAAEQDESFLSEIDAEVVDAEEEEDDQPLLVVKTDSAVTLGVIVDALASDDLDETDDLSLNLRARVRAVMPCLVLLENNSCDGASVGTRECGRGNPPRCDDGVGAGSGGAVLQCRSVC